MHRTPSRRRSAARLLSLAAAAGLGLHFLNPDDQQGGGGGGAAKADDKGGQQQQQQQQQQKDQPRRLELTEDELEARINARLEAERKKAEDKARREKDEADRKAAEEQGKFKELADTEKARNAELAAENRTLKTRIALNDHLAAKHPDYVGRAKYILPLIPADTADDALAKAVETAAAEFVKDNPVQAKGSAGAPPAPRGAGAQSPHGAVTPPANGNRAPRFSTLRAV